MPASPSLPPVWEELRIALRDGDQESIEALDAKVKSTKTAPEIKNAMRAQILWAKGDPTAARRAIVSQAKKRKLGPHEHLVLGHLFLDDGQIDKAERELKLAAKANVTDPRLEAGLGAVELGRDPREAETHLRASLSADPKNWHARVLLGMAQGALGRAKEAFETYENLTKEAPSFLPGWLGYAAHAVHQGKAAEAAERMAPIAKASNHPLARIAYADLLRNTGKINESIDVLTPVAANSRDPDFLLGYAELCMRAGHPTVVEATLEAIAEIGPLSPRACVVQALYCERFSGDLDEAIHWYRDALEKDPTYERAQIQLGLLLAKDTEFRDLDEAEALLEGPAGRANPTIAALLNLAIVRSEKGNVDGAKELAQRVLDQNPSDESVVEQAERLLAQA